MWQKILKFLGWTIDAKITPSSKSVVCVAPHTSYIDGVLGYIALKTLNINFSVISAEWLFFFPLKYIMKHVLHAWPVGLKSGNAITTACKIFNSSDKVNLVICPEGKLRAVTDWPKGFYIIAKRAGVPIDVVAFNYRTKTIHIVKSIDSSLPYNEVISEIRAIYGHYGVGRYHKKFKLPNIN